MVKILSRGRLAVELSKLRVFESASAKEEQYPTDSEVAADVLWDANYKGDVEGKTIADFGCGTGILGIGALLLGAKKAYFIDSDLNAIDIAVANYKSTGMEMPKAVFMCKDIQSDLGINEKIDVVIQNPPFGTRAKHADKNFLLKAFETANVIYSFHKTSTSEYIKTFAGENNFKVTQVYDFKFPLKMSQLFHTKRIERIRVSCFRMEKASSSTQQQ